MKKPEWNRVVAADGSSPLLFYLIVVVAFILLSSYLDFWLTFAAHIHPLGGL